MQSVLVSCKDRMYRVSAHPTIAEDKWPLVEVFVPERCTRKGTRWVDRRAYWMRVGSPKMRSKIHELAKRKLAPTT